MTFINTIRSLITDILHEEPLSGHTTFQVGGPAEFFMQPETTHELTQVWNACRTHDIPLTILGDGSNVLVSDTGIRGMVVSTKRMNKIEISDNGKIHAQAGARLSRVAELACRAGIAGFEFASGIPGTVGGAVYMNAGAYDHDIGEFCESVTMFDNETFTKSGTEMEFGYRKSFAQQSSLLILEAVFQLKPGNKTEDIRAKMVELNNRRKNSQPLESLSAGSTFKRPPGFYAGKLIEDSELKGFAIGGAKVSEKHAGFIVNTGNATAQDIYDLIEAVRQRVHNKFNVWLEPEVRLLGFNN